MLIKFLAKFLMYISGDYFFVVESPWDFEKGMYGVEHPVRWHRWDYPYPSKEKAQLVANELNENIMKEYIIYFKLWQ